MKKQPNIVFIFTDQQSACTMSCAGNADLHTPAMDELAENGTRFDLAYCTFPLCTPSRSSLMTGRMPHGMGTMRNGMPVPDALLPTTIGRLLGGAGYHCAYGGKWHLPDAFEIPEGFGFEKIGPFDDLRLADGCIEYIRRDHQNPFFLVASFDNPHNICEWARNQKMGWAMIPDVPIEQAPALPANFAVPPYEPEMIRVVQQRNPKAHPTMNYDHDHWRRYRHAYFRLCEIVDAQIGRILRALREAGLDGDTVVIFSSDHGDGHGAHQWNQKTVLYDEVTRIPLIVRQPDAPSGGIDRAHMVSNGLDLLPTLCDYAGFDPPHGLLGRSIRPVVEGARVGDWRDHLVTETCFAQSYGPQLEGRMVRTADYKYNVYDMGMNREQLFSMNDDPGEMVDLTRHDRYRPQLEACRQLLRDWCEKTGDSFLVPE